MIPIIFVFLGISPFVNSSFAESKNPNEYKVLSSANKKLSISDVKDYLYEGDNLAKNGEFEINNLALSFKYHLRINGKQDYVYYKSENEKKKVFDFENKIEGYKDVNIKYQECQKELGVR